MSEQSNSEGRFSQRSKRALTNPWVIGWLAMVALVFAINAFMVSQAVITSPGLVNEQYYDKGKNYHETVARRDQIKALGWEVSVNRPLKPRIGDPIRYELVAVDRSGVGLNADQVTLYAYRPADQGADFQQGFEALGDGRYAVEVVYPLKGIWDVVIQLRQGELHHEIAQRTRVVDL